MFWKLIWVWLCNKISLILLQEPLDWHFLKSKTSEKASKCQSLNFKWIYCYYCIYYNYCVVLLLVFNFLLAFMKLFFIGFVCIYIVWFFSICVTVQYNQRNDLPLCWSLFLYTWIKSVEKTFALFSRYIYIIIVCFILFCYLFCYFNYQYLYINLWVFLHLI